MDKKELPFQKREVSLYGNFRDDKKPRTSHVPQSFVRLFATGPKGVLFPRNHVRYHVRVESSSFCFSRESVSFNP